MHFTNLTPVSSPRRFAGRFATFALAALFVGASATAQSSNQPQSNPAPGTAPMQPQQTSQQPSSSSSQSSGQNAPGTAPITTQSTAAALAPGRGPSYENRWDVYGGLAFMNGQAGQNLPKRYNMGGGEGQFTYWLPGHLDNRLGFTGLYRFGAGTTPVISPFYNRVLVMQHIVAGGAQWRGPRNRYVAINYHAFGGGTYGIFDHAVNNYPGGSPVSACPAQQQQGQHTSLGLYCNHMAPWGAFGGSIDFNQGPKFAVRLSPDMTIEHFGTETRVFFGISMGVLYRGGHAH